MLLAAIAGCYTTTVRAIAGGLEFNFTDLQVEASGTVGKAESGYNFTQIVIRPNLKISSGEERDKALDLLKLAEKLCLVSRALGTIGVETPLHARRGRRWRAIPFPIPAPARDRKPARQLRLRCG